MSKTSIIIVVRGGNVQAVYSNEKKIDVEILDYDNLAEETDEKEIKRLEELIKITERSKLVY